MKKLLVGLTALLPFFSINALAQAQDYDEWFGGNFMLTDLIDAPRGYCLDLEGYASTTDLSAPVIVHSCKEGYWKDGTWRVNYPEMGQVYIPEYDLCLAAGALEHDAEVFLQECSDSSMQQFAFRGNGTVEVVSNDEQKFCLAVGEESRPTGSNMRRQTRIVDCANTPEEYIHWILPAEDAIYTDFSTFEVQQAEANNQQARAAAGGGAPAMGAGGGAAAMGAGAAAGMGAAGGGGGAVGGQFNGACAPCHGPTANGLASEFAPKLSGQDDWYLLRQMNNFANGLRGGHEGERWATQMQNHMATFQPAQMQGLVDLITAVEDVSAPVTLDGDISRGQQLYATCAGCHGPDGMGNEALGAPRLAGMSDWYMVIQLEKFKYGFRGDHSDDAFGALMVPMASILPDEQAMTDVVSYINTLAP